MPTAASEAEDYLSGPASAAEAGQLAAAPAAGAKARKPRKPRVGGGFRGSGQVLSWA